MVPVGRTVRLSASAFDPPCTPRNPDPYPLPPGPQTLAFQNNHSCQNQRFKLLGGGRVSACRFLAEFHCYFDA